MKNKDIEAAANKLEETKEKINEIASENFYDIVQISLADEEGKVIGKASMKYSDILSLTRMHAQDASQVVGMLFHAVESDTRQKLIEDKKNNGTENDV